MSNESLLSVVSVQGWRGGLEQLCKELKRACKSKGFTVCTRLDDIYINAHSLYTLYFIGHPPYPQKKAQIWSE